MHYNVSLFLEKMAKLILKASLDAENTTPKAFPNKNNNKHPKILHKQI